ncbi:MAG: HU family DNA-binding protein [Proteobacteria bacterium]|nr:HU family DNA-binding protein [Pseudomonadota bacterium]
MNKKNLIDHLMEVHKDDKVSRAAVTEIVRSIFDHISIVIGKKKRFSYPGFGAFVVRKRKKRIGLHPKSGKPFQIPARKTILFRPFSEAKKRINSK